jgi:hypothetical protein
MVEIQAPVAQVAPTNTFKLHLPEPVEDRWQKQD